jgi:hypothetical protein
MSATVYTVYETKSLGLSLSAIPLQRQNIVFEGHWEHCERWMERAEVGQRNPEAYHQDVCCQHRTHIALAGHYMGQVPE